MLIIEISATTYYLKQLVISSEIFRISLNCRIFDYLYFFLFACATFKFLILSNMRKRDGKLIEYVLYYLNTDEVHQI